MRRLLKALTLVFNFNLVVQDLCVQAVHRVFDAMWEERNEGVCGLTCHSCSHSLRTLRSLDIIMTPMHAVGSDAMY
jgi:hypothetical protein